MLPVVRMELVLKKGIDNMQGMYRDGGDKVWSGYLCPECGAPVVTGDDRKCRCPECRWFGRLAECGAEA